MTNTLKGEPVLVVGAGIMGVGIAQVAAQAGHTVMLFDTRDGAAAEAKNKLATTLEGLVAKGKLGADDAMQTLSRIVAVGTLEGAASARLVVEAIVENLAIKRGLFQQLEAIVAPDCVLATNTSSISVTAIANGLQHPGRLVGMHFFNPVPLMKLVEVVSGLQTDATVSATSLTWPRPGARWRCMHAPPPALSSTASPDPTTPRRLPCCWSKPPRPPCWTPA